MVPMPEKMRTNKPAPLKLVVRTPGRFVCAVQSIRRMLGAQPIRRPAIDPQLTRLAAVERAAEVLRYTTARAEYWLSPGGTLRAALRASIKIALIIAIPTITVGPVVILLLEGAAAASSSLAIIAANFAALSISLITAVIGFAVLIALIRIFLRPK